VLTHEGHGSRSHSWVRTWNPQLRALFATDSLAPLVTLTQDSRDREGPMTTSRRSGERTGTERAVVIDDVDKAIIEQLQQDGRLPYTKLGAAVGLSEAAVRQRVQRLVESGVVQIVAVTDPLTLGFRREAMIGLKIEGDLRGVADTIASIPEVSYVVVVSGSFDLLMEVVCEDDDHLLALLNDKVRSIPGVRSTETFTYLRLYKQTYAWGTR
jgi:Lrp/AsnC family transcriptional regulator, regulator for asnA, asnC and gidA